jgi:hypothetical protein
LRPLLLCDVSINFPLTTTSRRTAAAAKQQHQVYSIILRRLVSPMDLVDAGWWLVAGGRAGKKGRYNHTNHTN